MSQFYLNPVHQAAYNTRAAFAAPAHPHHAARSRRSARYNGSQSSSKSTKVPRISKDNVEVNQASTARTAYEAARSFDLEDDEVFCPWHLLTEDDLQSMNSSSSDRSSSSSGSPETSPMQPQLQPNPTFSLGASAHNTMQASFQHGTAGHLKVHQPLAQRARAIPIIDPTSRNTSPPTSISPARQVQKQQQAYLGRHW